MVSKRDGSKDTVESSTRDVVEHVSMNLPIYAKTQLFIEKDMKLTWKKIKDIFTGSFKEYMEDWQVCVNIHKLGLYKVACRYLVFPWADIIHWIFSHTNPETMALSSSSGTQLANFRTKNYHQMYHLSWLVNHMDALFYTPNNNVNTRNIMKCWVKEPLKFRSTPNQVYKTKSLRKVDQLLIIFAFRLYWG